MESTSNTPSPTSRTADLKHNRPQQSLTNNFLGHQKKTSEKSHLMSIGVLFLENYSPYFHNSGRTISYTCCLIELKNWDPIAMVTKRQKW